MGKINFVSESRLSAPKKLLDYIRLQKNNPERFVRLPFESETVTNIQKLVKKHQLAKPASVIVVGIGGSNLGTLAIWQALGKGKELLFAETLDARRLDRLLRQLRSPAVIAIVSKSGTTTETVANAAVLLENIKKDDQVVAITDENSKLWHWAKEKKFEVLSTPKEVSGRYSVFSAVGLFPLALAGVDIERLLEGARKITEECLSLTISKNPAALSALSIYENWKAGKTIHDTFIFEPDLEGVGRWYRQLTGESIGKNGKGITPTVSIGTTDLHSVAQLYLGGPKDKFTTFVSVKNHGKDFAIPPGLGLDQLIPDVAGKTFSGILAATLEGVKTTYKKQKLPFAEIALAEISEESMGALMQMKMMEMMYLGELFNVNPFDQPQVELYKEETRQLLTKL